MKIAVITQALLNNYGGLLQNFALQRTLKKMGYEVVTVDIKQKSYYDSLFLALLNRVLAKLLRMFGVVIKLRTIPRFQKRNFFSASFVENHICVTKPVARYSARFLKKQGVQTCIVGSDQFWPPKYNPFIEDMFLNFLKNAAVKKIAYAASFGVDVWEYSKKQTECCSFLAKKINSISVREKSGVKLCKEYLGVNAAWVLDPTLLLDESDYLDLCKGVQMSSEKYLAAYVLGMNENIQRTCDKIAKERGLLLKVFSADSKASLTIPEWLAMFRDASYVVTDSFHCTFFSLVFGKEFKCIYNETRGSARFDSLLNLYNSGRLEEMRQFSLNWLKKALES